VKLLCQNTRGAPTDVSIILIDWSVRESAHVLHYLADQTVSRERYEVLWIEYYNRKWDQIEQRNAESASRGRPPAVDKWLVMEMPRGVYYHKHLMYNVGIALASGRIVVICDSDGMMKPTFVESIVRFFDKNADSVLHLDQVRNNSGRFYPFNYPTFDEVAGQGALNWTGEKPFGLVDEDDPLHSRNYGACMAALRKDLIAVGGADEHTDYLGHVCGPYEMTFRLVNAGKREVWHDREWLYHVWHPGQAGDRNYAGPHDGRHISSTALSTRVSLRKFPMLENPIVGQLRIGQTPSEQDLLEKSVRPEHLDQWKITELSRSTRIYDVGGNRKVQLHDVRRRRRPGPAYAPTYPPYQCRPGTRAKLYVMLYSLGLLHMYRAIRTKLEFSRNPPGWGPLALLKKMFRPFSFFGGDHKIGADHVLRCWERLCRCAGLSVEEVILYEIGVAAKVLTVLSGSLPVRIKAVCRVEGGARKQMPGWNVIDEAALAEDPAPVIVATFLGARRLQDRLLDLGVAQERILMLQ